MLSVRLGLVPLQRRKRILELEQGAFASTLTAILWAASFLVSFYLLVPQSSLLPPGAHQVS